MCAREGNGCSPRKEASDEEEPQGDTSSRGELGVRGVRRSAGLGQVGLLEGQQVGPQGQSPGVK